MQRQKAVTAYFSSKQFLPFGFARQITDLLSGVLRRQTQTVHVYFVRHPL